VSRRPGPSVAVWAVQDRRTTHTRRPWVVRWKVDGRERTATFAHRAAADAYRSRLLVAAADGAAFSTVTGLPVSWETSTATVAEWAAEWLAGNWATWQPRTRRSEVEVLARLLRVAVNDKAPDPPATFTRDVTDWLTAVAAGGTGTCPVWLARHTLPLTELTRARCVTLDRLLTTRLDGLPMAAETARRYRKTARAMLGAAVDVDLLAAQPWPAGKRGRKARNSQKVTSKVDTGRLPTPAQVRPWIVAMRSHQPASWGYQVLTALVYFTGMRPSEALMLDVEDLTLPGSGQLGEVRVWRAHKDAGKLYSVLGEDLNDTKTGGTRTAPLVPELVDMLLAFIGGRTSGPLVRTRNGNVPTASNWHRAWKRASGDAGLRIYDLRHACASLWLSNGVQETEVAEMLGNSVETLMAVYYDVIAGGREVAVRRVLAAFGTPATTV
jgi:integrase